MTSALPPGERARLRLVFSWVGLLGTGLLAIGGLAAAWDWEPGAYVMIGALASMVLAHLVVGVVGYLQVMSRPWPRVRPLEDEDDW
jgi:membrane-associated PAP2 superfamily phosphatase